jgi:hypothetical protein
MSGVIPIANSAGRHDLAALISQPAGTRHLTQDSR